MTLKRLNITGLLILENIISSDLRFSCHFSKAGNLIHLNNLENTEGPRYLFFFAIYTVILGY